MASQRPKPTRIRNWVKEDMERLVCWMEENKQSLRGKQSAWHKDAKEQVFGDNEDITVKPKSVSATHSVDEAYHIQTLPLAKCSDPYSFGARPAMGRPIGQWAAIAVWATLSSKGTNDRPIQQWAQPMQPM
ncbi:hypothetical protein EV426DRAFT_645416 [Tirmania nivea]|nr:hypothetical protein EV426DRAFT_645416 [Tirmania nivea]